LSPFRRWSRACSGGQRRGLCIGSGSWNLRQPVRDDGDELSPGAAPGQPTYERTRTSAGFGSGMGSATTLSATVGATEVFISANIREILVRLRREMVAES
jgi:hypothetical protein